MMIVIGCSNEAIKGYVQNIEQFLEIPGHFISQLARTLAQIASFLRHFQAVLVCSGLKTDVASAQTLETGDNVCCNRLISMADMRLAIGIVDCGGKVIGFSHRLAR